MKYWRGLATILFWPLWIWPSFLIALSIFGFDGRCAVDSCNPNAQSSEVIDDIVYLLIYFGPPLIVTFMWFNWRAKKRRGNRVGI